MYTSKIHFIILAGLLSVGSTSNIKAEEEHSEFIEAFNADNTQQMIEVLKKYNSQTINKKSAYGETLLMIAAFIGNADIVRAAIKAGAVVDGAHLEQTQRLVIK